MAICLPETDSCYFCEIIEGRSDRWNVLAEDDQVIVMLNVRQYEVGQSIVLPRRHAPTIFDLSRDELGAIMGAAKHASGVMRDVFDPDGILIYQNNGVGSGQEVPHFHLHVVPRQAGSDWGFGPPHMERFENPEKREKIDFTIHSKDKKATAELMRSNWSI